MGDLSNHFSRSEWECFDGCGEDTVDFTLVNVLENLRDNFGGARVTITPKGGFRCILQNALSGGAEDSQHLRGRAADIVVGGASPAEVHQYLDRAYPYKFGVGIYDTFVHVDTKSGPARRWDRRT